MKGNAGCISATVIKNMSLLGERGFKENSESKASVGLPPKQGDLVIRVTTV